MDARLYAATVTPLTGEGACDTPALISHCKDLLARGCDGVALFGTTGEGPCFSVNERQTVLAGLIDAGIDPGRLIVGIGCAALPDAIALARHATALACRTLLFTPPFYFKDVDDDGLFDAFSFLIQATAEDAPELVAYHIPPVTGISLSPSLIARLRATHGTRIAAVKDSSADWRYTASLLSACPGMPVFVGHEPDLTRALENGAAGTISGIANLVPEPLRKLLDAPSPERQAAVDDVVAAFDGLPFVPAMKAALAAGVGTISNDAVRPPLRPLDDSQRRRLADSLARITGAAVRVEPTS